MSCYLYFLFGNSGLDYALSRGAHIFVKNGPSALGLAETTRSSMHRAEITLYKIGFLG